MTGAPRFQVVAWQDGTYAVEDTAITQGEIPAVAIFHARDLIDSQQEAAALAQRMNAQHDQQEAAKQRRVDLRQFVDLMDDWQVEWTLSEMRRTRKYVGAFETLFGTRAQ